MTDDDDDDDDNDDDDNGNGNEDEDDNDDDDEETDEFELDDTVGLPAPKLTAEEQQFLEASQGILFFEDEDSAAATAVAPMSAAKNQQLSLDEMMETEEYDNDNGDVLQQTKKFQQSYADNMNSSQAMLSLHSAADASHKRHVSPHLEQYAVPLMWEGALVGVSIAGFDIGTSQGPIADTDWYATTGADLEAAAQAAAGAAKKSPSGRGGGKNKNDDVAKRKIVLPEMVFPIAHVALEGHGIWLSWDASDCLTQWAACHASIPVHSQAACKGVSVLKSKDAALWDGRRKHQGGAETAAAAAAVFHYDWTYSTPFSVKKEGGEWLELDESGMRMELLTDQSMPILFFDEIVLFEDDLHDNGQAQYSVKLRIMPSCAYILARLWIRVDHVLVRARETRVLVDFFGIQPQIYRDIAWRECAWEDLPQHGLPTAVKAWSTEGEGGETIAWHNLVQQLPEVPLPLDIVQHAVLEYGASTDADADAVEL